MKKIFILIMIVLVVVAVVGINYISYKIITFSKQYFDYK